MQNLNNDFHLDSPETTILHGKIIQSKPSLKAIYQEHYRFFARETRDLPEGEMIEIGSGGGFIKEVLPQCLTSDVLLLPGVDRVFGAEKILFPDQSLAAIFMINVFHHIQDTRAFLGEASRTLKPGGKIVLIEPANTPWSRLVYKRFHHEGFDETQPSWDLPSGGRLSQANIALPWIVFCRDRKILTQEFPEFAVTLSEPFLPFRYILSGGLSRKAMIPNPLFSTIGTLEALITPLHRFLGMFMRIVVRRVV